MVDTSPAVTLVPVDATNWRSVAALAVTPQQGRFVAAPTHYRSCWLGGVLVDAAHQGRGYGRAAVREALSVLGERPSASGFALSYDPENSVARGLYASLGFVETGEEVDDGEVVARRPRT